MKNCKNCGTETTNDKIYCSYKCRNIFVNKNLRDYSKVKEYFKDKYLDVYLENPKRCLTCNEVIPYEKRENNYCNHSCSAIDTNKNKKGIKLNISEEGRINLIKSIKELHLKRYGVSLKIYNENPKKCLCCNEILPFKDRTNTFCNMDCQKKYKNRNRTKYQIYKSLCTFKFSLNDYPEEFDFSLVEKYGWYKAKNHGNNLSGVSRDHMYSIIEGFKNNVDPKLISHPANCKLMSHNRNSSKNVKSSITIEELKNRINEWNIKYK